jgi:ribonuclease P protein component
MTDLSVIRKRADFLAANRGLRVARPGFVLLAHPNGGLGKRFGVTVTKKIGNAVVRNRMKRRFRELLRAALPEAGLADHDHVLIGREGGIERDFAKLREELSAALSRAAAGKGDPPRRRKGPPRHGEGDRAKRGGGGSQQTPRSPESPHHQPAAGPPPHAGEDS